MVMSSQYQFWQEGMTNQNLRASFSIRTCRKAAKFQRMRDSWAWAYRANQMDELIQSRCYFQSFRPISSKVLQPETLIYYPLYQSSIFHQSLLFYLSHSETLISYMHFKPSISSFYSFNSLLFFNIKSDASSILLSLFILFSIQFQLDTFFIYISNLPFSIFNSFINCMFLLYNPIVLILLSSYFNISPTYSINNYAFLSLYQRIKLLSDILLSIYLVLGLSQREIFSIYLNFIIKLNTQSLYQQFIYNFSLLITNIFIQFHFVRFYKQIQFYQKMSQEFLKTDMFKDIRKLINIIDQVRDYGLDKQISLPRIAVLGTQSSGKSSLLQNIVGLDFLPRGSGVVTRRPLQLRLVHTDPRRSQGKPYGIFQNDPTKKYYNFNDVRSNIQKLTQQIAGKGSNIVNDPIKLRIYSDDCPDLTIIDLPGITRIDVKGQKDVEKVTTEMAGYYSKDPKTIILCVIPANQDLSTSDGLKLARQWDPKGERTIGVITKIDIMDKGTSAKRMLMNEEIHLKLGYIGIVNRAQEDINNKVPVQVALKNEVKFFNNHPQYSDLPQKALGTKSLTSKLSQLLVDAIRRSLPDILKQVQEKLNSLKQQLDAMGTPPPASSRQKSNFLMGLISDCANDYRNTLSGKYVANSKKQTSTEQIGKGAVIKGKFRTIFQDYIGGYNCADDYEDDYIKMSIKSHQGDQISGFPSMECFRSLLVPQLAKLKDPIYTVLDQIYQQLLQLSAQLNSKVFARFPDLLNLVTQITNNKLSDLKKQSQQILNTLIEAQMSTVFTNDSGYLNARDDLISKTARQMDDGEKLFINQIRERLNGYFRIVVTVLNDSVPKIIGFFLVKQSQDTLQMVLFNELNRETIFQGLGEPKEVEEQRRRLQDRIKTLQKSLKTLKKDPTVSKLIDDM